MKVRITKCSICDSLTLCIETEILAIRCKECLESIKRDVDAATARLEQEIDMLLSCADEESAT